MVNLQLLWSLWLTCLSLSTGSSTIINPSLSSIYIHNSSSLAEKIQHSTYSEVIPFFKHCDGSELFQDYISEAIALAFDGNLENFNQVVKFINDVYCPGTKHSGFTTLFNELESHGHRDTNEMMILIYWVKIAMSAGTDKELLVKYEKLKARIPSDMRAIIFEERVYLKSVYNNEYMYESAYEEKKDKKRLILTWTPGNKVDRAKFYFNVYLYDDNKLYYVIRNDFFHQGSRICLSDSYHNKDRRKTVSCTNGSTGSRMRWFVNPIRYNGERYYTITNWDGTQLYSPMGRKNMFMDDRRYVFTWKGFNTIGEQRYWSVQFL